mgnify:CR=1 FL=1
MNNCERITECIACGSSNIEILLDLQNQPLANSYKDKKDDSEELFPLAINVCRECYHVQLTHKVNPNLLFKNYLYVSGTSKTLSDYFRWFVSVRVLGYVEYDSDTKLMRVLPVQD